MLSAGSTFSNSWLAAFTIKKINNGVETLSQLFQRREKGAGKRLSHCPVSWMKSGDWPGPAEIKYWSSLEKRPALSRICKGRRVGHLIRGYPPSVLEPDHLFLLAMRYLRGEGAIFRNGLLPLVFLGQFTY